MIKNILFDLGGVLVELDLAATVRELNKLGMREASPDLIALFNTYELGEISSENFIDRAISITGITNRDTLVDAWNAIIVDFPDNRYKFLRELADQNEYNLFLISNTNALHLEKVDELLNAGIQEFEACFTQCYYSHKVRLAKPDPAIFNLVLNNHQLKPETCLFIDDTRVHINSARSLGINTWHFDSEKDDITKLRTKLC